MRSVHLVITFILAMFSISAAAEKIQDVEFPSTLTVGAKTLKLNGLGLRKKDKFGLTFKVYVAALYTEKKVATLEEAMTDSGPKVLKMSFLRRVNAPDLVASFEEGHGANCIQNCDASRKLLNDLTLKMPDVMEKGTMEFTFLNDGVEFNIQGRKEHKGKLAGIDISKNFLAIFIGKKPPTEEFKNGLLGVSAAK